MIENSTQVSCLVFAPFHTCVTPNKFCFAHGALCGRTTNSLKKIIRYPANRTVFFFCQVIGCAKFNTCLSSCWIFGILSFCEKLTFSCKCPPFDFGGSVKLYIRRSFMPLVSCDTLAVFGQNRV